ncbi:Uncharacterised protein r2_g386 [Pycnogonum litorale]
MVDRRVGPRSYTLVRNRHHVKGPLRIAEEPEDDDVTIMDVPDPQPATPPCSGEDLNPKPPSRVVPSLNPGTTPKSVTTRSGRIVKPVQRLNL